MSDSGDKRSSSEQETEVVDKKQKLDNDSLPVLSETLILDKVQEDTINQLVQSSSTLTAANGNI